jgi:hypothetical protein
MGILGFLNREKVEAPQTVEELTQRLEHLAAERKRLTARQADRARRRRELLTIDETDEAISELERESAAAELELERIDEVEPILLAELAAARGRRRQAEWEKIKGRFYPQAATFLRVVRQAMQEYERVVELRDEGLRAGFATEVGAAFAVPPWALKADLINVFEREVERASSYIPAPPAGPPAAPKPVAKATPPAPVERPTAAAGPIVSAPEHDNAWVRVGGAR